MDPSPTYIEPPEPEAASSTTQAPVATGDFNWDYEAGTLAVVLGLAVLWKVYRTFAQKQRR